MSDEQNFEFFVGGIEDAIIGLLNTVHGFRAGDPSGYLKTIDTYGGQLDAKVLSEYIDQLTPMFPLELVAYGDGGDKLAPATSPAFGEPRRWRHDCTFSVICCDDNARGEKERRRGDDSNPGVIKMISDVRDALAGLQLWRADDGSFEYGVAQYGQAVPGGGPRTLLTFEPLRLAGVEFIARLPQLTAYVQHVDTYFEWTEPDRRSQPSPVTELSFEVDATNSAKEPGTRPGVVIK